MRRAWIALLVFLAAVSPASAQQVTVRTVKLELDPAPAPVPALKYKLFPEVTELERGNAATPYLRAAVILEELNRLQPELAKKLQQWHGMAASELPTEEVRQLLEAHSGVLHEAHIAARRDHCDWGLAIETEGIQLRMPEVAQVRNLVRVLSVKAGIELQQGQHERALETARTALVTARFLGDGPTLVHSLVGIAAGNVFTQRLEELLGLPGAPNLYWALTALPRPIVDLRESVQWEADIIPREFPILRKVRGSLTEDELKELADQLARFFDLTGDPDFHEDWQQRLAIVVVAMMEYPRANRHLLARGHAPEEVAAMPALQVVAIHSLDVYEELRDHIFKWFYVSYPEARKGHDEAERYLGTVGGEKEGIPFASVLLPAASAAHTATVRLERQIAALRVIEAIRIYAAAHDRALPKSLADITEVPVPEDPATGEPFRYRLEGEKAILDSPPLTTLQVVYELTIRPEDAPADEGEQQ